jgi:hypothetical protein
MIITRSYSHRRRPLSLSFIISLECKVCPGPGPVAYGPVEVDCHLQVLHPPRPRAILIALSLSMLLKICLPREFRACGVTNCKMNSIKLLCCVVTYCQRICSCHSIAVSVWNIMKGFWIKFLKYMKIFQRISTKFNSSQPLDYSVWFSYSFFDKCLDISSDFNILYHLDSNYLLTCYKLSGFYNAQGKCGSSHAWYPMYTTKSG